MLNIEFSKNLFAFLHFYHKLKVLTLVKCASIKDMKLKVIDDTKFVESFIFFLDCTSRIIVSMLFSTEKMTPLMLEILHDISP